MQLKNKTDREFQDLAIRINKILIKNGGIPKNPKELLDLQKKQVENLYYLEQKFQQSTKRFKQTKAVYKKFIDYITVEKKNILTAQSYFRVTGKTFSKKISKTIQTGDVDKLMQADINAQMMMFIMKNWSGKIPKHMQLWYNRAIEARKQLIENNLPLAINRAKKFFRTTPKSHMDLLDFINICTIGLAVGIDKFTGKYSRTWRSVLIGRMVGFLIENYSQGFIRLYPSDKQILYRANSLRNKLRIEDYAELTKAVNESFQIDRESGRKVVPKKEVTIHQITSLMNSSSYLSADSKPTKDDGEEIGGSIYEYETDNLESQEDLVVKKDLMSKVLAARYVLSILENKIIKLKGVDF